METDSESHGYNRYINFPFFLLIILIAALSFSVQGTPIYTPFLSVDIDGNGGTTAGGWSAWNVDFTPVSPITNTFGAVDVEISIVGTGTGGRDREAGALEPLDDFVYANRDAGLGLGQHYLAVEFTGLTADTWYEFTFLAQDAFNGSTESYMAFDILNPADYLYDGSNNNYQPAAGGINVNDEPGVNGSTNPFYGTLLGRTVMGGGAAADIYDYSDSFFVKTDGTGTATIYAWNDSESYTGTQLVSLINGFEVGEPADFTWDGSSDNSFSTADNWADATAPSGDIYSTFNFGGDDAGDQTVTGADGAYTNVLAISFDGALGGYTVTGSGSFSMYSGATVGGTSGSDHVLDVDLVTNDSGTEFDGTDNLTISGDISGDGSITQTCTGNVTLTGTNSYTGGTTVSAGTMIGTTSSLQGTITNDSAVVFNQDTDGSYSGDMDGTGTLTKLGTGNVTLSGTNSYSGGTTVTAGTLTGDTDSLQGAITNNAAVVFSQAGDGTYSGDMDGSGTLTKLGAGNVTLSGTNSYSGGTTVTAGTLTGDTGSLQGSITNNAAVAFSQAGDGAYAGDMDGSGTLTKLGAGNVTLSGTNSYSGGTTVSAGTLTGTTSSLQGNITNNAAVVIDQDTDGEYADDMSGSGTLTKDGTGTLTLSGTNSYSGGTTVTAGTILSNTDSLQGNITNNAAVTFDQGSDGTFSGNISGSGTLTKSNSGNLTLSGTNSYSGGTTVSAGTLTGTTSSLQGAVTNDSAVVFNQNTDGTYSGDMDGTGSLTKLGTGNVTLSGTNSYASGTLISAGTLTGDTGSLQGSITNNAAVAFSQAGDGTYSGDIDGTGTLTKLGAGNVTLSGTNTYSGGTTVSAGTLTGDTDSLQGAVTNNAAVAFSQAGDGTYSGDMDGTGALTKLGAGNITLSGTNSYSGGTTVSAGTLTGSTSSLQGNVTNNSAVVFDQAGDGTYSGDMDGSGTFTKLGAGNVTLSGTNSYSGGTTITAGTLTGTSSSLQGDITNNSAIVFNQSISGTYADVISGTGTFTKSGTGSLTLSGNNTFTGLTTISAGTLNLSGQLFGDVELDGGVLMGTGTIANGCSLTLNGGTFRPGASIGTTTITGDYLQDSGSTLEVEIYKDEFDALSSDLVDVTGTATLESGSTIHVVDLTPETRTINTGDQFTIISAAGGLTDNGASITSASAVLSFTGSIVGNDYILEALRAAFGASGTGENNSSILGAIDSDIGTSAYAGDYVTLVNELSALSTAQLNAAAEQMLPLAHGACSSNNNMLNQRLGADLGGYLNSRRTNSNSWYMKNSLTNNNSLLLADASGNPETLGYVMQETERRELMDQDDKNAGYFFRPFGLFYNQDSTTKSAGFSAQAVGSHFGYDISVTDNFILGLGGAYYHSFIKYNSGLGDADIDSFRFGPYGTYFKDNWFVDGSVSLGYHINETQRDLLFGGINRTAEARYDSYDLTTLFTAGYDMFYKDWTITPLASMQYSYYRSEGFHESGAGAAGLDVSPATQQLLLGRLGLRVHTITTLADFKVAPEMFVGYTHQFTDDDSIDARLVNGINKFTTNIDSDRDDAVYYGAGLSSLLSENISAFVRYEGEMYSGNKSNSLNVGLTIEF